VVSSSEVFGRYATCVGTVTASLYVSGSKCKEGLHDYGNPDCVFRGTSDEGQPGYYTTNIHSSSTVVAVAELRQ